MPVLVSDEVLDSLICSFCEKYLSVGPIKIYNNRKVKCGRCPEIPNDPGIDSIYLILAEKILFKCINVYEGCRNILPYNDAKKYEETCLSTKFLCPICMENIWIYLLKNHVMQKHKQVLLNSNYISLNLQDIPSVTSKIYFYHNLNNLFVVNISFDKFAENQLQVNARLIGYNQQEAVGTQRYIFRYCSKFSIESPIKPLYSNNSHNFDISKIKMNNPKCQGVSYIEFDFQINSIYKTFNIPQEKVSGFDMCKSSLQLSEKDISAARQSGDMLLGKISLECYFCNQLCLNSVLYYQSHYLYENSQHHFLCYYCSIYYKTFNNENFLRATETILPYSVYSKLQYFCYWNCGYAFNASNLYSHQFICIKQSNMKCVKNTCNFISTYTDFENHYEEVHHFSKFE
ncbi:uncharacterized protein LOC130452610 [Diorhabda sublineata]|uniref:uncharacterized protein LOC130452610 n=1 Tax=Diorhabda sublineata TaxID=1163346 RepID=UPI0024E0761F|nr:uncharacterized protein LOC130452610 [Diorhabda sublineata]